MYTADPAARVFNDTLFVYTSHDEDTATWFNMQDWHVFSTVDMKKWEDHGPIMSVNDLSWASFAAWAPDCVYKNGTYYFYYPVDKNAIGVATSKSPYGPFKDPIDSALVTKKTPNVLSKSYLIDPTVFIDDDSAAYLLFGMHDLNIVKLNDNMVSLADSVRHVVGAKDFFEAVWMHKVEDTYYLSYSSQFNDEGKGKIVYATSKSPYGPFTYRGVILDEMNSGTNHHSIVEYKDKWYLFYHNSDLYFKNHPDAERKLNWKGLNPFRRSVCVDELNYNTDGTIQKVIPTTK